MIFVIGPLFSGKKAFAKEYLQCSEEEFHTCACWDIQDTLQGDMMESDLKEYADFLAGKKVVIATEIGGGIVPIDKDERNKRELAGRLNCLLAERAEVVVRVFCGIPMVLKGRL